MKVTGLGIDERRVASDLIADLPDPGYLLADAFYDTNKLHDLAAQGGHRLVTPRRFRGCQPVRRDRGSRRGGGASRRSTGWRSRMGSCVGCLRRVGRSRRTSRTCATTAAG
jgi:hypothetical protein